MSDVIIWTNNDTLKFQSLDSMTHFPIELHYNHLDEVI